MLAEELGIPQVMVPFAPGVNCAYGLLVADFRQDDVRTYVSQLADADLRTMNAHLAEMTAAAYDRIRAEGVGDKDIRVARAVDLRYHGQGYELEVPLAGRRLTRASLRTIEGRFHATHRRQYGFSPLPTR